MFSDEKDEAQYNRRDFAWRLILLGRVFDAMPRFKELVRNASSKHLQLTSFVYPAQHMQQLN